MEFLRPSSFRPLRPIHWAYGERIALPFTLASAQPTSETSRRFEGSEYRIHAVVELVVLLKPVNDEAKILATSADCN